MTDLPHNLYRAQQVRELDRSAIEDQGIPGITLMERAGRACYELLIKTWPDAKSILIVCGSGNNGGDGYVVARLAKLAGLAVTVCHLAPVKKLHGDALQAYQLMIAKGIRPQEQLPRHFDVFDVVVDAILGTGLSDDVRADLRVVIETLNQAALPVLAVDIPSGLHADSGRVLGVAVKAAVTISFIGLKQGLFTADAPDYCGQIHFDSLEVPPQIYQGQSASAQLISYADLKKHLPQRQRNSNKGCYGHVLVVGGNHGMCGAVRMAAEASARVGAGLVSVATRPEHAAMVSALRPEIMSVGVDAGSSLGKMISRASVIAIGPGLQQDNWARSLFQQVLGSKLPLLLDADALNLLAEAPLKRDNWVLTPHPGEAARLLDCSVDEIQNDRFAAVLALHEKYGGVCVLKGAGSLICLSRGELRLSTAGNPGMASGGMGDVLSGVISGLMAQGLNNNLAACLGVCLHGLAGDRAAVEGERGMLASDLMPHLRSLANP